MPKGKKYNAAEKHFEKKCVEWRQRIRELEYDNNRLREENYRLQREHDEMVKKANQAVEEAAAIAKLKDLSEEDIKLLIESTRSQLKVAAVFDAMSHFPRMY